MITDIKLYEIHEKALKIVFSCKTKAQSDVAERYLDLAISMAMRAWREEFNIMGVRCRMPSPFAETFLGLKALNKRRVALLGDPHAG